MSVCHRQQYLDRNDVLEPQHSQPQSSPHTHHHRLLSHWIYCVYSHDSFKLSLRTTSTSSLMPQPNSHTNTHFTLYPFPITRTLTWLVCTSIPSSDTPHMILTPDTPSTLSFQSHTHPYPLTLTPLTLHPHTHPSPSMHPYTHSSPSTHHSPSTLSFYSHTHPVLDGCVLQGHL